MGPVSSTSASVGRKVQFHQLLTWLLGVLLPPSAPKRTGAPGTARLLLQGELPVLLSSLGCDNQRKSKQRPAD